MKVIALIPARYEASRFPGKLMQSLGDKTVIAQTFLNTVQTQLFDEVAVVTDSDIIEQELQQYNSKVYRSEGTYECGSDRIAAFAKEYQANDIIINVQGDEPFTNKNLLATLIDTLKSDDVSVATLMHSIDEKEADNPNFVKVVTDINQNALIFSRAKVPFHRDSNIPITYWRHIGIYGFKQSALEQFSQLPMSHLEKVEKQEAMRFIENGIKIKMILTDELSIGIDTPEDLIKANQILNK